jgi:hypothetical protein
MATGRSAAAMEVSVDYGRMDDLFRAAANHPMVVLAAGIILVLVLMKSFNKLN